MTRRPDDLSDRVTRLEVLMENLGTQISRELEIAGKVHESIDNAVGKLSDIVERQDRRLGKIDTTIAKALGAVAVLVLLGNLFAPLIRQVIGLPT